MASGVGGDVPSNLPALPVVAASSSAAGETAAIQVQQPVQQFPDADPIGQARAEVVNPDRPALPTTATLSVGPPATSPQAVTHTHGRPESLVLDAVPAPVGAASTAISPSTGAASGAPAADAPVARDTPAADASAPGAGVVDKKTDAPSSSERALSKLKGMLSEDTKLGTAFSLAATVGKWGALLAFPPTAIVWLSFSAGYLLGAADQATKEQSLSHFGARVDELLANPTNWEWKEGDAERITMKMAFLMGLSMGQGVSSEEEHTEDTPHGPPRSISTPTSRTEPSDVRDHPSPPPLSQQQPPAATPPPVTPAAAAAATPPPDPFAGQPAPRPGDEPF